MNITAFAQLTKKIIKNDGFDGYLPTLCIPKLRSVIVLEGAPVEDFDEIERIALEWAMANAGANEEFLLAFRSDARNFRIIHRLNGQVERADYDAEVATD